MPGVVLTSFFLDNEDWTPAGVEVVVPHNLIVASGQDVTVDRGGIVITIERGNTVTIKTGAD